jgi:hypothetical protein
MVSAPRTALFKICPGDREGGGTGLGADAIPRIASHSAPSAEIFDLALTALGWRLAPASAARAKLVVRKTNRSRSRGFVWSAIARHDRQPQRHRGNSLNSSAAC